MSYGLAIDCGTSGISLALTRKDSRVPLCTAAFENPCRRFGLDVITRAANAQKNGAIARQIPDETWKEIAAHAARLCESVGAVLSEIGDLSFCANPTLTYLTLKKSTAGLTCYPYPLSERFGDVLDFPLSDYGFSPEARLYVAPLISAFLGSDVLLGFLDNEPESLPYFYADLGTNGEMLLKTNEALYGVSCAAGPAFEGGGVRCGMTAREGAIDHATYENGAFRYTTIGGNEARGICAGGLIEVLLAAYRNGLVTQNGEVKNSPLFVTDKITLTTEEVRALLLAKAAFSAGAELLFSEAGLDCDSLSHFTLSGAFGEHLDRAKAAEFGLFDADLLAHAAPKADAALLGACRALWDKDFRDRALTESRAVRVLDAAADSRFTEAFCRRISFSN